MRTDLFDFELPEDGSRCIPPSRAMPRGCWWCGRASAFEDRIVRDLPELLRPGDALVFNDTRVIPAALRGRAPARRARAQVAVTLHQAASMRAAGGRWRGRPSGWRRATASASAQTDERCLAGRARRDRRGAGEDGEVTLAFDLAGADLDAAIAGARRDAAAALHRRPARCARMRDRRDYQTIFAAHEGAVAAPTAGLHFTPELMAALDERGIARHRDAARRRRHVPAGEGGGHRRARDARRVGRGVARDRGSAQRGARGRRAHRRRRHHRRCGSWRARRRRATIQPFRGDDRHLHHARLSLPRRRRAHDQLPPAALDAVHAGLRPSRGSTRCRRPTRTRIAQRLSLLFLRRRLPALAADRHERRIAFQASTAGATAARAHRRQIATPRGDHPHAGVHAGRHGGDRQGALPPSRCAPPAPTSCSPTPIT